MKTEDVLHCYNLYLDSFIAAKNGAMKTVDHESTTRRFSVALGLGHGAEATSPFYFQAFHERLQRAVAMGERKRDSWLCGYATALAGAWRVSHDDTTVAYTLVGDGLTLQNLIDAGAARFDIDALRQALKDDSASSRAARGDNRDGTP